MLVLTTISSKNQWLPLNGWKERNKTSFSDVYDRGDGRAVATDTSSSGSARGSRRAQRDVVGWCRSAPDHVLGDGQHHCPALTLDQCIAFGRPKLTEV